VNSDRGLSRRAWSWIFAVAIITSIAFLGAFAWAAATDAARKADLYSRYDENAPWFDGQAWDWFLDMFNMPSLKPQEEGTIQNFPTDSVPRSGVEPFIPLTDVVNGVPRRDLEPLNPTQATPESIARGRWVYETYCAVCHASNGMGGTPVTQKGMPAPPIAPLLPILTDPHLYNKARLGGPLMPAYGFQTTKQERWDLVNYMKSAEFGKDAN
jgi:cytochrome c5